MYTITYQKHKLIFRFDAGTSRGVLKEKDTFFVKIQDETTGKVGIGEAAPLPKLSLDDLPDFEKHLAYFCEKLSYQPLSYSTICDWIPLHYPSILFAFETALLDLKHGGKRIIFENDFALRHRPIPINGLIWMGTEEFMQTQIEEKIKKGFHCIKIKVGAIDFKQECSLLESIRKNYTPAQIEIRLDANGAFSPSEALNKLHLLASYSIHSIEQPIQQGQIAAMRKICENSPIPIALDEELIGQNAQKRTLLESINPHYIILKPTLVGGIHQTQAWIEEAEKQGIDWWITSALESNIGLNAICQLSAEYANPLPQGLGTGQLFHTNIPSPLCVENGVIFWDKKQEWGQV